MALMEESIGHHRIAFIGYWNETHSDGHQSSRSEEPYAMSSPPKGALAGFSPHSRHLAPDS